MGKRQSKENLRSQEIITLDNIEHSNFSVLIEAPNGSPQPMRHSTLKEFSNESLHIQFRVKMKEI